MASSLAGTWLLQTRSKQRLPDASSGLACLFFHSPCMAFLASESRVRRGLLTLVIVAAKVERAAVEDAAEVPLAAVISEHHHPAPSRPQATLVHQTRTPPSCC